MLDWIFQVHSKTWATPQDIYGLIEAFDDLLYPQANLGSGGLDAKMNAKARLDKLLRAE